MSERIRGSYDDALYKSTDSLLYFTNGGFSVEAGPGELVPLPSPLTTFFIHMKVRNN